MATQRQDASAANTSTGHAERPKRTGIGDMLILECQDVITVANTMRVQRDVGIVAEDVEFRQDTDRMVETVRTTVLDDHGTTSSQTISVHPVN